MKTLPETLEEAVAKAEEVKMDLIQKMFAAKIIRAETKLMESVELEQLDCLKAVISHIKRKRIVAEKFIDAILFERIQSESRFKYLKMILPRLFA